MECALHLVLMLRAPEPETAPLEAEDQSERASDFPIPSPPHSSRRTGSSVLRPALSPLAPDRKMVPCTELPAREPKASLTDSLRDF
ncbi:hypothetical protein NQZ68_008400 [Dissostichus eleginoides]|nr:hypothetical protein NQZ68_008400 [Dissostichus eleginoides]